MGCRAVIFASVGSMLPFDRLVKAVDEWARDNPGHGVFIQIGEGAYEPHYASYARIMPMADYRERLRLCDLFVAHVGMGAILQGLEESKQMLLMPRQQKLGEHTTDHQLHTAARFGHRPGIKIVDDADALKLEIGRLITAPLVTGDGISDQSSPELIAHVARFLDSARPRH